MNREEILNRSRQTKQDDGVEYAENQGRKLAVVVFAFVAGVIAIVCIMHQDHKTFCATMGLLLTHLACMYYGNVHFAGKKMHIIGFVVCTVAAVAFLASFFLMALR